MSDSRHCNYKRWGSAKKSVKEELRTKRRQRERNLITKLKKGYDPDGLLFPVHPTETSNWWNWD